MEINTGHVIKSSDIQLEGSFQLDFDQSGQVSQPSSVPAPAGSAKVTIAENTPQYCVLEVTCSCASKTYVRCQYDQLQPSEQAAQTSD